MLRGFVEHHVRKTESMDGLWELMLEPERKERKQRLPLVYNRRFLAPAAWETIPGFENFHGRGWMRRKIFMPADGPARFAFGGVSHTATVFVDGKKVGSHYDGFVPWDLVVPHLAKGEHELVMDIDNSFNSRSALHIQQADHFTSGGITRPAEVQVVPAVFVDKVFALPRLTRNGWTLEVRVRLRNVGRKVMSRRLRISIAGQVDETGLVSVPPLGTHTLKREVFGFKAQEWSAELPKLYDLSVELLDGAIVTDDLIDRVGFREIKIKGPKLLLNGRDLRLRGYNRHECHGQFGHAVPVEAMAYDLQLMKDLGCNFVRTSHYPNDMRFLDMCDEMGFYVWEETNSTSVPLTAPCYRKQIDADARSMVEWHYNRPSIIIWGTLNECASGNKDNIQEHARMLRLLKKLDGSRPVTYASNAWQKDLCLKYADIVSWNWYEGWYWGSPETIEAGIKPLLKWQDSSRSRGGKGKPVIISEVGASGIYGSRLRSREKWSEEYQADVLDESLRVYLNHPRICGVALWQFCDVRIAVGRLPGNLGKPNARNGKGTVDEYRRPKIAYDAVKRRMLEAARKLGQ